MKGFQFFLDGCTFVLFLRVIMTRTVSTHEVKAHSSDFRFILFIVFCFLGQEHNIRNICRSVLRKSAQFGGRGRFENCTRASRPFYDSVSNVLKTLDWF